MLKDLTEIFLTENVKITCYKDWFHRSAAWKAYLEAYPNGDSKSVFFAKLRFFPGLTIHRCSTGDKVRGGLLCWENRSLKER